MENDAFLRPCSLLAARCKATRIASSGNLSILPVFLLLRELLKGFQFLGVCGRECPVGSQVASVAWFGDCLVSLAKAVQETRYRSELPFLHGAAKTVGSSPPSFVEERLVGRLQPLGVALGADIFNGNFQGEC